jgi:ring-1,2-phenylacetyl-CoA epoxidase subunit PaaE
LAGNTLEYHSLEIRSIEPTASNAVCVTFQIPDELREKFEFVPGQHLTLRHQIDDEKLRRFYSICSSKSGCSLKSGGSSKSGRSSKSGSEIRIGVRRLDDGRFSRFLNETAKVGDKLEVLAPRGRFNLATSSAGKHIIAFASGSGITPIYSILSNHLIGNPQSTATLVYGNRATKSIMLCEDINDLKDQFPDRFQIIHMLSREGQDIKKFSGRIDKTTINNLIGDRLIEPVNAAQIFICGPANMIDEAQQTIVDAGADSQNISVERFTAVEGKARPVSAETKKVVADGVNVSFVLDGVEKEFSIDNPDDSILIAAQKSGFELPFSCAGGMCATCRCKLVEGEVEMAVNYALEPWELEAGFVLACQSRPKTGSLRLDFDAN